MNKKLLYLKELNLFESLDHDTLMELNSLMFDKNCPANTEVFSEDDKNKFYVLKKGRVEFYNLNPSGKRTLINTAEKGSVFGNIMEDITNEYFAVTSEDSIVCSIDKDAFFEFASKHPEFAKSLFSSMLNNWAESEYKVSILASDDATTRLKKLLKMLVKKHGKAHSENKVKIDMRFTHEQLAEMMGITRQTTTKIINELEKQNVISRDGKYIIVDESKLEIS